ncbi:MAG: GNAT family N-acetyltransferase [Clostridia bacterium]|nr:GNAT family N-acetyltransferase [Clostridia bacterium]
MNEKVAEISLREITPENLEEILALDVAPEQKTFVSSAAYALAQAYVHKENAFPFGVYAGDVPVGFIMFGFYRARNQFTLWKFFIDKAHQNKGCGRAALLLGMDIMARDHGAKELYTGVALGNEVAERLYKSVGFRLTGLEENGMKELKYVFDGGAEEYGGQ